MKNCIKIVNHQLFSIRSNSYLNSIGTTSYTYKHHSSNSNSDHSEWLKNNLITRIKSTGPITVHEYMQEVLTCPSYGYYTHRAHIGDRGDFITSPEVSQVFGELVTIWVLSEWMRQGKPSASSIIELGPGNGTLVSDILRVMKNLKMTSKHFNSINLVETSPKLIDTQYNKLCIADSRARDPDQLSIRSGMSELDIPIQWFASINDIPISPRFIIANEFFDSLPVHQFIRTENGLREVFVDIDSSIDNYKKLRFVISSASNLSNKFCETIFNKIDCTRSKLEISLSSLVIIEKITQFLNNTSAGACLILDYGTSTPKNEFTLRAFQNHKQVDPLDTPGLADITVDVNFNHLSQVASQTLQIFGPITQNQFLHQMGIRERISTLMKSSTQETSTRSLIKAYEYLTSPNFMGTRFKVMALMPKSYTDPPFGFIEYPKS